MAACPCAVNVTQLVAWNPSLSYNASDPNGCLLKQGYKYCVAQ
jgi:hypothetical protein